MEETALWQAVHFEEKAVSAGKMAPAAHQAFVSHVFEALLYVCILSNIT